jgi:small subunit ribosomal protein S10
MGNQVISIKLKGFDSGVVDNAATQIVGAVKRTGARVSGPIPLPRLVRHFTVNRSPHVDKKSREQFQVRTHSRLIVIYPTMQTVDALMKLDLAAGVSVEIKLGESQQ